MGCDPTGYPCFGNDMKWKAGTQESGDKEPCLFSSWGPEAFPMGRCLRVLQALWDVKTRMGQE